MALPRPAPDAVAEIRHSLKHIVHIGHDVVPVDNDGCPARRAQRDMQHCPIFGDVNLVTAEHGVDPRPQTGLLRELKEEPDRLVGHAILRIIEVNTRRFGRHTLAALIVSRE